MNDSSWRQFLSEQGAHWNSHSDNHIVSHFNDTYPQLDQNQCLVDLSPWALLSVSGAEARTFMQGQVTCDMAKVNPQRWLHGANCNIKGRAVFSFYCTQLPDLASETFFLLLPASTAQLACDTLKKYALFSQTTIKIEDDYHLLGLIGDQPHVEQNVGATFGGVNTAQGNVARQNLVHQNVVHQEQLSIFALPGKRYACVVKNTHAQRLWQQYAATSQPSGFHVWTLAGIRCGYVDIEFATSAEFVPQLLNFHLTDSISFTKGCYLGQEVVARMAYRGTLKRHLRHARVSASQLPPLNQPVYGDKEQGVGNVVSAVKINADSIELLAVVTEAAFETNTVYLDKQKKHKLDFLSLPYAITKENLSQN